MRGIHRCAALESFSHGSPKPAVLSANTIFLVHATTTGCQQNWVPMAPSYSVGKTRSAAFEFKSSRHETTPAPPHRPARTRACACVRARTHARTQKLSPGGTARRPTLFLATFRGMPSAFAVGMPRKVAKNSHCRTAARHGTHRSACAWQRMIGCRNTKECWH